MAQADPARRRPLRLAIPPHLWRRLYRPRFTLIQQIVRAAEPLDKLGAERGDETEMRVGVDQAHTTQAADGQVAGGELQPAGAILGGGGDVGAEDLRVPRCV